MNEPSITVENLSKRYNLGQIGARTFGESVQAWWHRLRGRNVEEQMGIVDRETNDLCGIGFEGGADADKSAMPKEIWALREASFEVQRGEVLGIIGSNGAGKSTLLKLLTRITEPTSGRAVLRGRVSSLLEVGTGFHPQLTGRENVYLNGAILGMNRAEISSKFDEIVSFAEVETFIDTPVKRYSSGMYVRLAFAVAAHLEPEILLVDEVLAVGDFAFRAKCLGRMHAIAGEGRTVLFVSHNMASIQSLCDRAILLQGGHLVFDGPVDETVATYLASVQDRAERQALTERTDREGGTVFRFASVDVCDGETLAPVNVAMSGQDVVLKLDYVCRAGGPIRDAVVAVTVRTATDSFLLACRSDAVGRTFTVSPGHGSLLCKIPRLPLNQGRYTLGIVAYGSGGETLDAVQGAAYLDVSAGDYYGTGKLPAAAHQGVFIGFDWNAG